MTGACVFNDDHVEPPAARECAVHFWTESTTEPECPGCLVAFDEWEENLADELRHSVVEV